MEDWEQFFAEKSKRRAGVVRRKKRLAQIRRLGVAALVIALMAVILLATRS